MTTGLIIILLILIAIAVGYLWQRSLSYEPVDSVAAKEQKNQLLHYDELLSRYKNRRTESSFAERECALLLLRFSNIEYADSPVEKVLANLQLNEEFYIAPLGERGSWHSDYWLLIEDVHLPDRVEHLKQQLMQQLGAQVNDVSVRLESVIFPFDGRDLDALSQRLLTKMEYQAPRLSRERTGVSVELNKDGIAIVDYGDGGQVTAAMVEEARHIYQRDIAPDYPDIKLPQLAKARRMLMLDKEAIRQTRIKESADVIAAVAVAPRGMIEKHLMKMYAYYSRPPYPFKVFDNEEDALAWLKTQVTPEFYARQQALKQSA